MGVSANRRRFGAAFVRRTANSSAAMSATKNPYQIAARDPANVHCRAL
jgi:hypothetical protein